MVPRSKASKEDIARRAWFAIRDLVLDNERRHEVSDSLGLSFGRIRAIRRISGSPMTMGELAAALGVDAPNATLLVDALETQGLVERRPHPTDRRVKLVVCTAQGTSVAKRAEKILARPPDGLLSLSRVELEVVAQLLEQAAASADK